MRMAFAITLGVTLVSISGIAMAELLYPKYFALALFPYLWMIVGTAGILPICLILLLIPRARRRIGSILLISNVCGVAGLILLVTYSKSVEALMHV